MPVFDIINKLKQQQIFKYRPKRAIVNMQGPDAKKFLQRMGTSDLTSLSLNTPMQTCFLNNKGRMVDYVSILQQDDHSYAIISSFAHSNNLIDWLQQFHFVEDFSMSVGLEHGEWLMHMPKAAMPPNYAWASSDLCFFLKLGSSDYPALDHDEWETLRIHALMPELSEVALELMPQNIGLKHLIAEHKGCYVGQEVVAKAITYQKHVKKLGGAKLSPEVFLEAKIGDHLEDEHGNLGLISSRAPLYMPGWANALVISDDKKPSKLSNFLKAEFIFAN